MNCGVSGIIIHIQSHWVDQGMCLWDLLIEILMFICASLHGFSFFNTRLTFMLPMASLLRILMFTDKIVLQGSLHATSFSLCVLNFTRLGIGVICSSFYFQEPSVFFLVQCCLVSLFCFHGTSLFPFQFVSEQRTYPAGWEKLQITFLQMQVVF